MKRFLRFCNLIILTAAILSAGMARIAECGQVLITTRWAKEVHPGIIYHHYKGHVDGLPVHIYITSIALARPDLMMYPILAYGRIDRLETVESMARRYSALVAVNGSFFNRKKGAPFPVGFLMVGGRPIYFSHGQRSAFGVTGAGDIIFGYPQAKGAVYVESSGLNFPLSGMNRPRKEDEAVIYTPEYGDRTRTNNYGLEVIVDRNRIVEFRHGNSAIPPTGYVLSLHGRTKEYAKHFIKGDALQYYFAVNDRWLGVESVVTGGPLLVQNGKVASEWTSQAEKLKRGSRQRIPQTAVGSIGYGHLLFVVVDGRQRRYSVGLTYSELADFLVRLGVVEAVGMDDGGSSTMVIKGKVVNRPSDGSPRMVNNGLSILAKPLMSSSFQENTVESRR
ncbi:MAG: phosphodiester glycosidase family protein [bacterium]